MSLGSQLAKYRAVAGLSYPRLEELSGVAVGTINALEKRGSESSKYWGALASALGLAFEQLADETTDHSDVVRVHMMKLAQGQQSPTPRTGERGASYGAPQGWPFSVAEPRMRATLTADDWSRINTYILAIVETREAETQKAAA